MARNARTFSDIDLNFTPSPISLVVNAGNGLLSTSTSSDIVVGTNTSFNPEDILYRNIYVLGTYVGKVKETIDTTHLRLFNNATTTFSTPSAFTYSNPADLVKRYDENAIKASVKNLILTTNYERKFHPEIGSQVRGLMFEQATPMLGSVLERAIRQTIDNFEPRVTLDQVDCTINPDNNSVNVSIYFTILNTQTPQFLNLVLERTR